MDDRNLYGRAVDPDGRGKFGTFSSALGAAFTGLTVEKNDFFDSLRDRWDELFPTLPMHPGRYEDGKLDRRLACKAAGRARKGKPATGDTCLALLQRQ